MARRGVLHVVAMVIQLVDSTTDVHESPVGTWGHLW